MGSGKSTQGKKLASLLRMRFVDLDSYIQKQEDKLIQSIFDDEGELHFRNLETKYLKELIEDKNDKVFSLGGGSVCFNNNIELIKKNGILIYIEMPAAALAERLNKSRKSRPLIKNLAATELLSYVETKLSEREKYYLESHLKINGIDLKPEKLKELILSYKSAHV